MNYDHAFISLGAKKPRGKSSGRNAVLRSEGGGGLYSKKGFIGGDSAARFNPLSFYTTIFDRKVALRLPFIDKCYPFHIPT